MANIRNERDRTETTMLIGAPAHAILVEVFGLGYWVFHSGTLPKDLSADKAHIVCTAEEAEANNFWKTPEEVEEDEEIKGMFASYFNAK